MTNKSLARARLIIAIIAVSVCWLQTSMAPAQTGAGIGVAAGGNTAQSSQTQLLRFRIRTIRSDGQPVNLLASVGMSISTEGEFHWPEVSVYGFESLELVESGMNITDGGMAAGGMMGGMPGMDGSMGMGMMGGYGGEAGMGMGSGMPGMGGMGMPSYLLMDKYFNPAEIDALTQRAQGLARIYWCSRQFGNRTEKHSAGVLDQYRAKLSELLQAEYKARLIEKDKELKNLEAQVANLRQDLVRRQQATKDVVAFEVQRRVLGAQGLDMNGDELSPYEGGQEGVPGFGTASPGMSGMGGYGAMPGGNAKGQSGATRSQRPREAAQPTRAKK